MSKSHTCQMMSIVSMVAILSGCSGSDRTIHLADREIQTGSPVEIRGGSPITASRDGKRLALLSGADDSNTYSVTVVDTETQEELGTTKLMAEGKGPIMFGLDGSTLYLPTSDGYVSWTYGSNRTAPVTRPQDGWAGMSLMGGHWNYERSITCQVGHVNTIENEDGTVTSIEIPGVVTVAGGKEFQFPVGDVCGFDMYGNAWFGRKGHWTMIDHNGSAVASNSRPEYLTDDQSRDRGSMHLNKTSVESTYKGATAYVSCVWLSHDKAIPYLEEKRGRMVKSDRSFRAGLVFAGPDVQGFAFVPGRDTVYIETMTGDYLVDFDTHWGTVE